MRQDDGWRIASNLIRRRGKEGRQTGGEGRQGAGREAAGESSVQDQRQRLTVTADEEWRQRRGGDVRVRSAILPDDCPLSE